MICLNCERKRGYHCQGKYHVFCFVLILRERERDLLFWTVFTAQIFLGAFMAICFTGQIETMQDYIFGCIYGLPFFFFLHIKLNNNDLTTTATNTSWPPALRLGISLSRKKRISLSRKISYFLFCPYFERERERESSTLLDSVYCIDIFGCI